MVDLEREMMADLFFKFDSAYAQGAPLFGKMFVDMHVPWLMGDEAETSEKGKKKSMIASLVDLYNRHKGNQKAADEE